MLSRLLPVVSHLSAVLLLMACPCSVFGRSAGAALQFAVSTPAAYYRAGASMTLGMQATGGSSPYRFSVSSGVFPPGLGLSDANASLGGVPTTPGHYSFTVRVTDQTGEFAEAPVMLDVRAESPKLQQSPPLYATRGKPYSHQFAVTGGVPPLSYVVRGILPAGLEFNSGAVTVSGTPQNTGMSAFEVEVRDALFGDPGSYSSILVALNVVESLGILLEDVPRGKVGSGYSHSWQTTGGKYPYTWWISGGFPPPGLAFGAGGTLSGTPLSQGSFPFTLWVRDSLQNEASIAVTVHIDPAASPLALAALLPGATAGVAYSAVLGASGGTPPYRYAVVAGALPGGLSLSTDGILSGTPAAPGTGAFTVEVTDAAGAKAQALVQLTVSADPRPAISPQGVVDAAGYGATISEGAWVSIFGRNLAQLAAGRNWRDSEIVDGQLPTALEGVTVTIGGQRAAISYVGPEQLNVQAPAGAGSGLMEVVVSHAGGMARANVNLQPIVPAFFRHPPNGRKYVAAQHADYTILAPAGLFAGVASQPARPGETVVLYGSGFGATNPATPGGALVTAPAPLADQAGLRISIGGVPAMVEWAGVTMAGVWQINVRVPEALPTGDARLEAQVGGVATQGEVWLPVQR